MPFSDVLNSVLLSFLSTISNLCNHIVKLVSGDKERRNTGNNINDNGNSKGAKRQQETRGAILSPLASRSTMWVNR
jgi:hypothetical protein